MPRTAWPPRRFYLTLPIHYPVSAIDEAEGWGTLGRAAVVQFYSQPDAYNNAVCLRNLLSILSSKDSSRTLPAALEEFTWKVRTPGRGAALRGY